MVPRRGPAPTHREPGSSLHSTGVCMYPCARTWSDISESLFSEHFDTEYFKYFNFSDLRNFSFRGGYQQQPLGSGGTGGSEMAKSTQKLTTLADESLGDPQLKG